LKKKRVKSVKWLSVDGFIGCQIKNNLDEYSGMDAQY